MNSKEIAKAKRLCHETAAQIHDIVEESLWSDYASLPELALILVSQVENYQKLASQETQE